MSYDNKIYGWDTTTVPFGVFIETFTDEEINDMIDALDMMRFPIEADYFNEFEDETERRSKVVSNYIRRWMMEDIDDGEIKMIDTLMDKLKASV